MPEQSQIQLLCCPIKDTERDRVTLRLQIIWSNRREPPLENNDAQIVAKQDGLKEPTLLQLLDNSSAELVSSSGNVELIFIAG